MEDGIPGEEQYDGIPMGAGILELEGQEAKLMQFERKARPTTRQKIAFLPNTSF